MADLPNIAIGDVLDGKYEITDILGAGSMGVVYEALHTRLQRKVALKTLRFEYAANTRLVNRFEREARASSAIGHPNIVQIFDAGGDTSGMPYLAMERLYGQNLGDLLREAKSLETSRAIGICCQVLEGLKAAHGAGILHRDIKPDNIFLARDSVGRDKVKILDFGISKFLDLSGDGSGEGGESNITQVGSIVGTPNYMSPEQICALPDLDMRADLWSVVCVLYKCLSGRTPFAGKTRQELMAATLQGEFVPLVERCPDIPIALNAIVRRGLMPEREDRYANASALLQALRDVHVGSHADTLRVPPKHDATQDATHDETVSDTLEDPQGASESAASEAAERAGSHKSSNFIDQTPGVKLPSSQAASVMDETMLAAFDNLADRFLAQESEKLPITASQDGESESGATRENALDLPDSSPFEPPGADEPLQLDIESSPAAGPQPRGRDMRVAQQVTQVAQDAKDAHAAAAALVSPPLRGGPGANAAAIEEQVPASRVTTPAPAARVTTPAPAARVTTPAQARPRPSFVLWSMLALLLLAGGFAGYRYATLGYLLAPGPRKPATVSLNFSPPEAKVYLDDSLELARDLSLVAGDEHTLRVEAKGRMQMATRLELRAGAKYSIQSHLSYPMFTIDARFVAVPAAIKDSPPTAEAIDRARSKLAAYGDCPQRLVEALSELPQAAKRPEALWIIDRDLTEECGVTIALAADMPPKIPALDAATTSLRLRLALYNKAVAAYQESLNAQPTLPEAEAVAGEGEEEPGLGESKTLLMKSAKDFQAALSQAQSKWLALEVLYVDTLAGDATHSEVRNLAVRSDDWMRSYLAGAEDEQARDDMTKYYRFLVSLNERRRDDFAASGVTAYLNALQPLIDAPPGEHSLAIHNYSVEVFNKILLPLELSAEPAK